MESLHPAAIDRSNLALIVRQIATADFPQDYLTKKWL
jgi:hypothetical protein